MINKFRAGFFIILFLSGCHQGGGPLADISIDLSDAQALFTVSSDSDNTLRKVTSEEEEALGALRKLMSDGTIEPVILEDGTPSSVLPTSPIFVGPDGKIYMTFDRVTINGDDCRLLRITITGDNMECYGPENGISDELTSLFPGSDANNYFIPSSNHFDSIGNFYFLHYEPDSDGVHLTVFKKLTSSGEISTILQYPASEVSIDRYVVLQDGTIIFLGTTDATGASFTRRTTENGGVENIDLSLNENAIIASNGDLFNGTAHITFDGSTFEVEGIDVSQGDDGEVEDDEISTLVTSASDSLGSLFEDERGNVYYILDSSVYRIYPGEPVRVASAENSDESDVEADEDENSANITLARTSGDYLYFSGVDSDNNNIFRRVDLTDETFPETDLLQGEEIEIFRFQVWSNGDILFGGLRLSDNQLILGEIDGESLEITVRTTTTTRVDDLVLLQ